METVRGVVSSLIGAYVYKTMSTGDHKFEKDSELTAQSVESKPREYQNISFSGKEVKKRGDRYLLHQSGYSEKNT